MKELTLNELKEVQLQIMDYVDHFCREYNINYTLACGTLLGAIRHDGFIPWDDDIDIHLLRSEYKKFTELWNKNGPHPYELVNIESGNNMGYPFGKIHDPRTVTYIGPFERTGVFIDVFPIDYVIDEEDYRKRQAKIQKLYKKRYAYVRWLLSKEKGTPFLKRLYAFILKPWKSYNQLAIDISTIAQQVDYPTEYVYEMVCTLVPKHPVPAKVYDEYIDHKFEDRVYRVVKDYETYLSIIYRNWRKLPPIEKRVAPHHLKIYWRNK